jgi:ubiquinone/menaquinone biosynthesis C-methylase UbiE
MLPTRSELPRPSQRRPAVVVLRVHVRPGVRRRDREASPGPVVALSLTPIDEERVATALGRCRGLLLDIGCGTNELARRYRSRQGTAIGVDIYPWPGADVVCDTTGLPFPDGHFDTVILLACLNHVPLSKRSQVLREARRVLKDEGQLLITMINPVVGLFVHTIRRRYDLDQLERGMEEEEAKGLWDKEVKELLAKSGLRLMEIIPFVFGLNRLYAAEKDGM